MCVDYSRGIRSRIVAGVNGITMHALEAGFESPNRPAVLLIHGFPELGYSWRHVMLPLAKAGYHVIAPDQRGYGKSGGTDVKFDDDLTPFSTLNRVRDMMALINALGHRNVSLVVGHDFGSPVAGWCALTPGRLSIGGDDTRPSAARRCRRSTPR
jgi:pimeloyl-ACP methyl ester carboxylesterase